MQWIEKFDLFLFDLDGLLVDTERLHYQAYQVLCNRYHHQLPWDFLEYLSVAHMSNEGLRLALEPILGEAWDDLYPEKKKIYIELLQAGQLRLMPGVEKLLKELALLGSKRCVVTHSSKEQVATIKELLPLLKTIPVWITREDYLEAKPSPEGYFKALELLFDHGDKVIGFEDSFRGFQALRQTPALPILICDQKHPQLKQEELQGIHHFPSFSKIENLH